MTSDFLLQVSELLNDVINNKPSAEDILTLKRAEIEFPIALLECSFQKTLDPSVRQLAAYTLKNYVDTNWSSKSDKYVGPESDENIKNIIKSRIINGLQEPIPRLRVALAYVVSKIAHMDWPDAWPNLFQELMNLLQSKQADAVHGALRVLIEFIRDDISDQQFPFIAPILIPELYSIFCNEGSYTAEMRAKCLVIFRDFSEILYMVKEEHPEAIENYLEPLLPNWMEAFKLILNSENQDMVIVLEVVRTIVKLVRAFPKQTINYLIPFLEPIWNQLVKFSDKYVSDVVLSNSMQENFNPDFDFDGEDVGFESLLFSMFEYVGMAAKKKGLRTLMTRGKNAAGDFLILLVQVSIKYLQISVSMEEDWLSDMNKFIQDEDDEALNFNMRIAVEELITTLVEIYPDETIEAVWTATQSHFQQSCSSASINNSNWWKIDEACLLVLGKIQPELLPRILEKTVNFDLSNVFEHVIQRALSVNELPFLQGRALWFSSQYPDLLSKEMLGRFIEGSIQSLKSPSCNHVMYVFSLKAVRNFCISIPKQELEPFQMSLLESIALMGSQANEEALYLLLETLTYVVKINENLTAQYEHVLGPLLLNVWSRGSNDILIIEIITELFTVLATNKEAIRLFEGRMVPVFLDVINENNLESNPGILATSMELLSILIKYTPDPVPSIYTGELFTNLLSILMIAEDHAILQNAQGTLKILAHRDIAGIIKWTDGHKNGLEYVIKFVAKLLNPSLSESASIFVGELIIELIRKASQELLPILPELLSAIITRLESAKMPSFIQTLVLVFAHYIQTQMDSVLSFLSGMNINGRDGLTVLMKIWLENADSFQGHNAIKQSTTALGLLYKSQDSRLYSIHVKGDLISSQPEIVTRSMAKYNPDTFSSVPVPVKILKLLISELDNRIEAETRNFQRHCNMEDQEGEEWEDLDDDSGIDEYGEFSEWVDETGEESEEEDLMNQLDLVLYLKDFFSEIRNLSMYGEMLGMLNKQEIDVLDMALGLKAD